MRKITAKQILRMISLFLSVMALFLISGAFEGAVANDTTIGFTGGSPYPQKNTSVKLLEEDLTLILGSDGSLVEVTYILKNLGEKCELTLGFPYYTTKDVTDVDMGDWALGISEFTCSVDGRPVEVRDSRGPDVLKVKKLFSTVSWKLWNVTFDRGQTRKVYHRFKGSMGSSTGNSTVANRGVSFFEYILTTARNWQGPIGTFKLTVKTREPLKLSDIYGINYLGFTASNNSLVLEKKDFVPEKELYISVFGEFERRPMKSSENWLNPSFKASASYFSGVLPWYSTVKLTEASLEGRSAKDLTILRNEIYARHGRVFQDNALKEHFEAQRWYYANPSYSDRDLSEIEQWNIQFIMDYQKKNNLTW